MNSEHEKKSSGHDENECDRSRGCVQKMIDEKRRRWGWLFPIVGFLALIWFLIRVLPRPSRMRYPCQKVAGPLAFSFMAWIGGMLVSIFAARKMKDLLCKSRFVMAVVLTAVMVAGTWLALDGLIDDGEVLADSDIPAEQRGFTPTDQPNSPMGQARGIHPGRVVWDYDPATTSWDGETGHWWDKSNTDQEAVRDMIDRSVKRVAGEDSVGKAWNAIFRHFNERKGRGDRGYEKGEKVAIKLNLNNSGGYEWENGVNNSPQMVLALLRQLVREAGVEPKAITVLDASRVIGDPIWDLCRDEFPGVRFVGRRGENGRIQAKAAENSPIYFTDPELEESQKMYLPESMVQATYLINFGLMKGHDLAGVTLCAKNHFGSIWWEQDTDKWNDGWSPGHLHKTIVVHDWKEFPKREMGTYNPLVELMGHEHLGGKTVLYLVEGLYAAPSQGGPPAQWESAPFDGDWTSSLFVSQDPVAIESVALDFLRSEPTLEAKVRGNVDNYLHEAARADDPPSGVEYDPEADGVNLDSLGVHEHWDNEKSRNYSRNLGNDKGIELIQSGPEKRGKE